jgi:glucokinase
MAIIAIDIGGTKIATAIMSSDGTIMFDHKNLLKGRTGNDVGKLIADNLYKLIEKAKYHKINIESVGVCVPGIANSQTGRVWAPNISRWENYPLKEVLRTAINDPNIEIYIDSDRICSVYAEIWQGAAKNCNNVIFIAVGTGIGAGIVIDGRALHGAGDIIGATGWMALAPPYDKKYDACGCFEYYASGNGIGDRAKDAVRNDRSYRGVLRQKPISRITSTDVFDAYKEKDPLAIATIKNAVQFWGMGAANLVSLFNPEKIIWGGGVFGPGKEFINDIYDEACKWAQPISIKRVEFLPTQLSGNAGLIGAGYLALKKGMIK